MFVSVGISFRKARAEVRDRVSFSPEAAEAFRLLLAGRGIVQSAVLSTCNRCEVFCWGEAAVCADLFRQAFPTADLTSSLEVRAGTEALTYLFRIASGLESMVLGEYQILGQVKDSHAAALAAGSAGRELDRIFRDAVSCGKRVKTELDLGAVPPSVCRAGMAQVERLSGLRGKRVFVIGSGRTGTLAAKLAKRGGAASVTVCNRSIERTQKLVEEIGARAVAYESRYDEIAASDVVVSATASPHVVVRAEEVVLDHPVTFLDLASPRDVDPAVAESPWVKLVSIDTIGELAAGDQLERARLTARGQVIVDESVRATEHWLEGLS